MYARRLAKTVASNLYRAATASVTRTVNYVAISHPHDTLHLLASFDYWNKEVIFAHRFRFRLCSRLFVN